MKRTLNIAAKDIRSAFSTPMLFAICSAFLVLAGFFFFTLLKQYNLEILRFEKMQAHAPNLNDWVVVPFFRSLSITLVFLVPLITMRLFYDERQSGALEILLGSKTSIFEIILGKFLAISFIISSVLLCSFIYPLMLVVFSDPEILPIFFGFFSLLLFSWTICSVGLVFSALIKNPIIVGVTTLVALLVSYMLTTLSDKIAVLAHFSPATHLEQSIKGVITGADMFYFISLILISLFLANRSIESQTWRT